jgi:hypothetical protein
MRAEQIARTTLRQGITAVGSRADRIPAVRAALTHGLTVFVFHEVTESPSSYQEQWNGSITPQLFTEQVLWLRDRFRFISPTDLRQLGGQRPLPLNAGLITFDDAWAGVFRNALPILDSLRVPSICFLNMATVAGEPDLGAARAYRHGQPVTQWTSLDVRSAAELEVEIRDRYQDDARFSEFQGPTATPSDLLRAADDYRIVWFGSHLFHHWDVRTIDSGVYADSLTRNAEALDPYPNVLPVFATPHGYAGGDDDHTLKVPRDLGCRILFTGTGRQNRDADRYVLDRVALPSRSSSWRDWWHATHRGRLLGRMIG